MTTVERFRKFLDAKDITNSRAEKDCGFSNGLIGNAVRAKTAMGSDKVEKILSIYKDLSAEWLLTGEGDMIKSVTQVPQKSFTSGKPYYNVDFELGFVERVNDQTSNPDFLIDFAPFNTCDCWCNAHGNSMYPTIASGDIVALKQIKDFRYLINGEIYAIITKNGLRTIKRVHDNGDSITLIADNKDVREQTIPKDIISHVFMVKGSFKAF